MRLAATLAILLICGAPTGGAVAASDGPKQALAMSRSEARRVALDLIRFGHLDGAEKIIAGLLEADPEDVEAHYLTAKAAEARKAPTEARQAARRMFRFADRPEARFAASSIAARAALAEEHFTLSQFWLRRAYQAAPDARTEEIVARDYRMVRAANPFRFAITASISPSSNVNDGSSDEYNTIAGQDAVGILSGSAQALDGVEARASVDLSYRIAKGDLWRTDLLYSQYERRVDLSADAEAQAPDLEDSDFDQTTLAVGLRQDGVLPGGRAGGRLTFTGGRTWYGGEELHDFRKGGVEAWLRMTERLRLSALVSQEDRTPEAYPDTVETYRTLSLGLSFALPGGSRIGGAISGQTSDPRNTFQDGTAQSLRLTYAHGQPVLGIGLSGQVSVREEQYPDYIVGVLDVPGGRHDRAWAAGVTMAFGTLDYAGFIPEVSVTAQTRDSNVSRFETEEVSVTFGIKSAF